MSNNLVAISNVRVSQDIDVCGTCLQGYIDISYQDLVAMLGEPGIGDEYKVDAEWSMKFSDGTLATIYNYKDGVNYNGAEGTPTAQIRDWHIGGKSHKAVELVGKLFEGKGKAAISNI